jgi:hypothetical protein
MAVHNPLVIHTCTISCISTHPFKPARVLSFSCTPSLIPLPATHISPLSCTHCLRDHAHPLPNRIPSIHTRCPISNTAPRSTQTQDSRNMSQLSEKSTQPAMVAVWPLAHGIDHTYLGSIRQQLARYLDVQILTCSQGIWTGRQRHPNPCPQRQVVTRVCDSPITPLAQWRVAHNTHDANLPPQLRGVQGDCCLLPTTMAV